MQVENQLVRGTDSATPPPPTIKLPVRRRGDVTHTRNAIFLSLPSGHRDQMPLRSGYST